MCDATLYRPDDVRTASALQETLSGSSQVMGSLGNEQNPVPAALRLCQTGFDYRTLFSPQLVSLTFPQYVEENVIEALGLQEPDSHPKERIQALVVEIFRADFSKARGFVEAIKSEQSDFELRDFFLALTRMIKCEGIEGGGFVKTCDLRRSGPDSANPGNLGVLSALTVLYFLDVYGFGRMEYVKSQQRPGPLRMSHEHRLGNMVVADNISAEDQPIIEAVDRWIVQAEMANGVEIIPYMLENVEHHYKPTPQP
ncbi:hypothetical protein K449DRAFT_401843 [Hypoxylon sp. EC38]|nr:hypothetical protein K449DRAFT_401843 [Hypoxylon sp. EC38]